MGDVFLQEETGSTNMEVVIQRPSTNLFRAGTETRVKVVKKHHTATVFPYGDQTFTVITLELEDKKDEEAARFLWKAGYEALSTHRSIQFPKMVGLMKSNVPSFILCQELANGHEVFDRPFENNIVFDYLEYTRHNAIQAIRTTLTVSEWWSNWSFDVNAKTWHYDIARASLEPHYELFDPRYYTPTPLPPRATPPRLVDNDIITCFEKTFGDALYLWASCGRLEHRDHSLNWQHGLLTFGAVVHKYGILAHFPSTPNPEWAFENRSGIKASYSAKVFIDEISVVITRDFSPNLPPAYLFVPPLCVTLVNGMYCIPYPLCNPCFYWAIDPAGVNVIPEKEWDNHGISNLAVEIRLGTTWLDFRYSQTRNYMRRKGYEPTDGKRYAQDHGYPELIFGDPHDQRMIDLNGSKCDSEHTLEREQAPLPPRDERTMTRWVKGSWGFLKNACKLPLDLQRPDSDHRPLSRYWTLTTREQSFTSGK
ncbi:hypothetical protein PQX77_015799 [Marasmius sp. AFHP31]|nr:hypothetical protein PQX77_015799 [Marasmius sp. AFHP31]